MSRPTFVLITALLALLACPMSTAASATHPSTLRVATFNTSLNDDAGGLIARLQGDDPRARKIAATIQRVRPDVVLLNEFDHDAAGTAATLFNERYLWEGQFGEAPIDYPHRYFAAVNTGVPSGLDIDGDGRVGGGEDAWGFGLHPGQYGMLLLSRFPIDAGAVRQFRLLRWSSLPGAHRPMRADGSGPYHGDAVWQQLRLSSKSHWDVPLQTPWGEIHLLASHPTPPVFDGPEDRNGRRNFDEIRLWVEYLDNRADADWLVDDAGKRGGLEADARFVVVGDQNADPVDGSGLPGAIAQLLQHPRLLRHPAPRSRGGVEAHERLGGVNLGHRGDPAEDTSQFGPNTGNMRVDFVLPSTGFDIVDSGVFWPLPGEPGSDWLDATDHRMVWLDLQPQAR